MYRIVDTDNFNGDYPNESFVEDAEFETLALAQCTADEMNMGGGPYASRYFKVVEMPYELQPGFEP